MEHMSVVWSPQKRWQALIPATPAAMAVAEATAWVMKPRRDSSCHTEHMHVHKYNNATCFKKPIAT